ncbi:MAG: glycerol-3-phosphate 1-O-acyltransferase PlsY [bacterium]|nr:glycerol-3-phosphate 1-O-acyltransferase PlsY [bacterium]
MDYPRLAIVILLGYLLGGIPYSYLIGRTVRDIDLRRVGSGNLGATNTFREIGARWGVLVMILDAAKGWLAVWLGSLIVGPGLAPVLAGLAAILGHSFTPYLRFKGGKGVATSAGVFICLAPVATGLAVLVFAVLLVTCRYVSVASMAASLSLPLLILWRDPLNRSVQALALLVTLLIWIRHRTNIVRLVQGTENRFELSRKRGT